jgi:Putative phage metallopeptidase
LPLPKLPPPILEWSSDTLPRSVVRRQGWPAPAEGPFDFCAHIRALSAEVIAQCPKFRHIDIDRLLFSFTPARSGRAHGLHARVTPMRFCGGALIERYGRTHYQVQRYRLDGREVLYLVTFCLPRFLNLSFDEKFVTLFHELYHIGPAFDGDLRRHHGRCHVHTHSKKDYDEAMGRLVRAYLANGADQQLHAFLRLNFAQLKQKHSAIVGVKVPRPRLFPVRSPTEY